MPASFFLLAIIGNGPLFTHSCNPGKKKKTRKKKNKKRKGKEEEGVDIATLWLELQLLALISNGPSFVHSHNSILQPNEMSVYAFVLTSRQEEEKEEEQEQGEEGDSRDAACRQSCSPS